MSQNSLHVGLIMDGNGRWAKQKKQARIFGHKQGLLAFKNIIDYAAKNEEISQITAFALSRDNLKRSAVEIQALIGILHSVLQNELEWFCERHVAVNFIGDLSYFSNETRVGLKQFTEQTNQGSALKLNIALNYSGKHDILELIRENSHASLAEIEAKFLIKDIDLLIRTSGEQRLSDFCLWQLAYAELYFTEVLWPDFAATDFEKALLWFKKRERRFGEAHE